MEAKAVRRLCIIFFKGCSILSPPRPGGTSAPLAPTITPLLGAGGGHAGVVGELLLLWGSTVGVQSRTPVPCHIIPGHCQRWEGMGGCILGYTCNRFPPDLPPYPSQQLPITALCLPERSCHGNRQGLTGQGQLLALGTQPWHCQSRWHLQCPAWHPRAAESWRSSPQGIVVMGVLCPPRACASASGTLAVTGTMGGSGAQSSWPCY